MDAKRSQHSVRVRDDLWDMFSGLKIPFQDFVEEALVDKLGLNSNLEEEIAREDEDLRKRQELNEKRKSLLKRQKTDEASRASILEKKLAALLEKPLAEWNKANRDQAVKVGRFKEWEEAKIWITDYQAAAGEEKKENKNMEV